MAFLREWQGGRYMLDLLIIYIVGWLAWLSVIALAQLEFSEALTGSVSFPDVGIACLGNLAVFITSLLRGRLDLEIGARDVLATNRGPELKDINGYGLTSCRRTYEDGREYDSADVVMLSCHTPDSSLRQFMKYIHHSHGVDSIVLQCLPLGSSAVNVKICECNITEEERCRCIVFQTIEEITIMIALQMPGTLKKLSDSMCLLPCWNSLANGCHGCNHGLLHVIENGTERTLLEEDSKAESPAAVCEILYYIATTFLVMEESTCICIPVRPAGNDNWTKLLIRFLRSKDKVAREVRVMASDAMESYIARSGESSPVISEYFNISSLVVPRFIEVLVNIVLTGWLRVDGFSSSLIARRTIRDYVVDSKGTGFAADAFVRMAWVKSNQNTICQRLWFRGSVVNVRNLSYIVGCVNLICSISWGALIAFEGGVGKWYGIYSVPLSTPRVIVILVAIGIALVMDLLNILWLPRGTFDLPRGNLSKKIFMIWGVTVLEIGCIVGLSLGIKKGLGRWVYTVLHVLVWVKWAIGSYILGDRDDRVEYDRLRHHGGMRDFVSGFVYSIFSDGILVYSSAFMLNAILAGIRGKWEYLPS